MSIKLAYIKEGVVHSKDFENQTEAMHAFWTLRRMRLPIAKKHGDEPTEYTNSTNIDWFVPMIDANKAYCEGTIGYDTLRVWKAFSSHSCFLTDYDDGNRKMLAHVRIDMMSGRSFFVTEDLCEQEQRIEVHFEEFIENGKNIKLSSYCCEI